MSAPASCATDAATAPRVTRVGNRVCARNDHLRRAGDVVARPRFDAAAVGAVDNDAASGTAGCGAPESAGR